MGSLLEEAIREYFGERCPDFEPGCPCCRAWAEFDKTERLRAALKSCIAMLEQLGYTPLSRHARAALGGAMKLNINEERFLAAVDREGDHEIGAGALGGDA